jgi:hypothetical protein
MKSSIRLDHPATWNEVCWAISFSYHDAFELNRAWEADGQPVPHGSDPVRLLAEEIAWFALASEAQDPNWN